jgi:hypothetical protein
MPFTPPLQSIALIHGQLPPLTLCFIASTIEEMAPNSKQAEGEENLFLPHPVDLDKIPLVDKDQLIMDTKCEFDFSDLQSWLREVFLD